MLFKLTKQSFSTELGAFLPIGVGMSRQGNVSLLASGNWGHRNGPPQIAGLRALHYDHADDVVWSRYITRGAFQRIQGEKDTVVYHPISSVDTSNADLWREMMEMSGEKHTAW